MILKKNAVIFLACGSILLFFVNAFHAVFRNKEFLSCHDDAKLVISGNNGLPQTNLPAIADFFLLSSNLIKQETSQLCRYNNKIGCC
jgi:hypothetical protein